MHVTDLEKGDTYDVNAESGQTLKPLGFIGSDCIMDGVIRQMCSARIRRPIRWH